LAQSELEPSRVLDESDRRQLAGPVAIDRSSPPVELFDQRTELERHAQLATEVDGQAEILGHQVEREALVVVALEDAVDVTLEEHRTGGSIHERLAQTPDLDAGLRAEHEDL